ncbi:MAG: glycine cleavage system protein GcvH [Candidatus Acidiferrales bacterium]
MAYPTTYRYTRDHEWIKVKDDLGTVGLTDYAQCQLSDIVFVELPGVGTGLEAGKPLGVVESVKAANDIYSPVSGDVIQVNGELRDAPEKINVDPHCAGWLIKVRLNNPAEVDALMDAGSYEAYVALSEKEGSD